MASIRTFQSAGPFSESWRSRFFLALALLGDVFQKTRKVNQSNASLCVLVRLQAAGSNPARRDEQVERASPETIDFLAALWKANPFVIVEGFGSE